MLVRLPVPPSVNNLYYNRTRGNGRGRIKTPAYRKWLAEADKWLLTQKRDLTTMTGRLEISIRIPPLRRGDASNKIKAAEDFLVSRKITGDDRNNHKVSIEVDHEVDCCEIAIEYLDS